MNNTREAHNEKTVKSGGQSGQIRGRDHARDVSAAEHDDNDDDYAEDDEDYGPKLPSGALTSKGPLSGPAMPHIQDLELRRGMYSSTHTILPLS